MIINDQIGQAVPRIALIGEAMIELSELDFGAATARIGFAGDTLNTAVYLARDLKRTGWSCDYLTVLGQDALSERMLEFIRGEGVGIGAIGQSAERAPAVYAIDVDPAGERRFTYWRDQSAARLLFQTPSPSFDALAEYGVIYFSAITLAILPEPIRHKLIEVCASLKAKGHVVVFDSNYRPRLWPSEADARRDISAMWAATTIALPSHDDECLLYPSESTVDTIARISALGAAEIALKCGADGPVVWAGEKFIRNAYTPAAKVVDTTAAGDSFNAGYLAARLKGAPVYVAAHAGHALASKVICKPGAIIPMSDDSDDG
ncbi:MAG: sugar kinase [Pseudomonadota bacterium]